MAAGKGSSFLLKENSTGTPATVGGLRSTSMIINGEAVDITTKDSNALLQAVMIKLRFITRWWCKKYVNTASGVFTDSSTENLVRGLLLMEQFKIMI